MSDPKLKAALDELGAVMRKYELDGCLAVGTRENVEYSLLFNSRWCRIQQVAPDVLRLHSVRGEYPSAEAQAKDLSDTLGFAYRMRQVFGSCHTAMDRLLDMVNKACQQSSGQPPTPALPPSS